MSLAKKIGKELIDEEDSPEEIEHDLLKDSVLEIANTDFKINDEFDNLPMGSIRRDIGEDLSLEYEGKPISRKTFSKSNWIDDKDSSDIDSLDDAVLHSSDKKKNSFLKSDSDVDDSGQSSDDKEAGTFSGDEFDDEDSDDLKSELSEGESDVASDHEKSLKKKKKKKKSGGIDIFSSKVKDIGEDVKKGNAIKNQLLLWENLIECRIKLQKGLVASNRLLQNEEFAGFKSHLTPEEELSVNSACKGLIDLLENFIKLKECLIEKCPEYVNFKKSGNILMSNQEKADDDEEITSESENEVDKKCDDEEIKTGPPVKKRKTIDDYSNYLKTADEEYKPFRNAVIQKWNDKTRLASGKIGISKFAILEQSTLKQIEQILLDKDRLMKRTQVRRSKLNVLGKEKKGKLNDDEKANDDDDEVETEGVKKDNDDEVLDCEIFDDDDFYHKLLKDFIDRKTSDITDPTQLGKQWTKLQKLRSKMKKKVDTRATKGRKIRYTVYNKLVNFMAPVPYCKWDDKVEQDLFRSLFGRASQPMQNTNIPAEQ